jgi:hypothetical protein
MAKFFDSFTVTGAAGTGIPSAVVSGIGSGLSQSALASQNATLVLSRNSGQRDSLLQALNVLFDDPGKQDHSVLETYLEEIRGGVIATNDSLALVVRNALLGLVSGVGHVTQIPSDVVTVVQEIGNGLSNLQIPTDEMQDASKKAFAFDAKEKEFSLSAKSVSKFGGKQSDSIMDAVEKKIHIDRNSHANTHARVAASTSAGGSVALTAILPSATALLTNAIGQIPREGSAISHFSAHESESKADDNNVYHASTGLSHASQNSDSHALQEQSQHSEAALYHLEPAMDLMSGHSVSSPLATALLRLIVISSFGVSARVSNKTAIATTEGRLQKALVDATAQGPSGGVDRINSLHSNLCSLSNIMRLCAENLGGASVVKTSVQNSEVLSGRSVSVLLSHVSELAEALGQLVHPKPVDGEGQSSGITVNSTVDSAHPDVLVQSEAKIKEVLDRIEQANNHHIIPDLNQDMASQLGASSHATVASFVTTHSLFSNPAILMTQGCQEASKINDAQKNEALMTTLPVMTQTLNEIQAFTRNFMSAMEKDMDSHASRKEGSLLSTHKSFASNTATVYWAASGISLLCDEMLTICRSLTLIDQNRLQAASEKSNKVESKGESAQSVEQISWDSHSGQDYSATHAIPALRLTLSHTGIALMKIALDLHNALKNNLDTVQQDLAMHTLQRSLLNSSASASVYLAEGLLLATGAVSASPESLNGSVNYTHKIVHATDAHLHPAQTHGSEQSTNGGCSESSQSTGFSTDLVAGTVTNILKVLAQGGLIGLDTTLKLVKVLEIISLHRDSHIALQLESNDSANPNGLLVNTLSEPMVGSCAGTGAICMNLLAAFQSLDKRSGTGSTLNAQNRLQDVIDQQIEGIAVLKDEEEHDDKKGLEALYKTIIDLLSPNAQASNRDSLVKRLDLGGISLSSYHTQFGAYGNDRVPDLHFAAKFANEDDAHGVLRKFIDEAKDQSALLKSLNDALPPEQRTAKAQIVYEHIFEELYQHYKQIKMSDIARHGFTKRKPPTRDEFEMDMGLVQVQPEVDAIRVVI